MSVGQKRHRRPNLKLVMRDGEVYLMDKRGNVVASGVEGVRGLLLRCPRCGEPASGYSIVSSGIVYAYHRSGKENHVWYVAPMSEALKKVLEALPPPNSRRLTVKVHPELAWEAKTLLSSGVEIPPLIKSLLLNIASMQG
ncbi:hypothetical protein [Infirmifilum sp.]|uniref:hypothetical protein n=1 Tax=Infirmifilum sp. TaxID=2856575 RepID=UPI003D110C06